MRIAKSKDYAIVTGDVVGSSELAAAQRRKLNAVMAGVSKELKRAFKDAVPLPAAVFRGDSWQLLVEHPAQALRVALYYRASLRAATPAGIDTRLVIAVGRIDFIPGTRVAEGDGPAYRLSGRALQAMVRRERMRFVYPSHPAERPLALIVHLLDGLVMRWSDKQSLAVSGALRGWNQEKIASKSWSDPISQQAVAQHLDRAGWSYVAAGLEYFEETLATNAK
ncbi:MAG: hypothetical protein GF355_09840 [Candidatus Eisenbacteria bacterium]|nr:hypothetical protein [Candidatus Eisenbacteria bacterium]